MAFEMSKEKSEEVLIEMYLEVSQLREGLGKDQMYRDHYCEGAVFELLEKNVKDVDQRDMDQLLDNYSVMHTGSTEFLTFDEKVNASNAPRDFDEMKSYFKTLINKIVNKRLKNKLLKAAAFNYIALAFRPNRDGLTIGMMLLSKNIGIDRVYECNDGVYLRGVNLDSSVQPYGLEIMGKDSNSCSLGPNFIDLEQTRDGDIYHFMLFNDVLSRNRISQIDSINLVVVNGKERINFGEHGDEFNTDIVHKAGGLAHCLEFPKEPKFLNGGMQDCCRYVPTSEEMKRLKAGNFQGVRGQGTSLADRVNGCRSIGRGQPDRNLQPSMEENSGGALLDFSDAFTTGAGKPTGRNPLQDRAVTKPILSSSRGGVGNVTKKPWQRANTTKTVMNSRTTTGARNGTPIVKTTRSMQLREQMNKDKSSYNNGNNRGVLEPIRESNFENSFGKPRPLNNVTRSTRKPWPSNTRSNFRGDDSRMDTNENRPVGSFAFRSPVKAFRNNNTNAFGANNDRGFNKPVRSPLRNSLRRSTMDNGSNWRGQPGRASDVSMRSVTPIKQDYYQSNAYNNQYERGNPFKGSTQGPTQAPHNPFKQPTFEPQNPFGQQNPYDHNEVQLNPFANNNSSRFHRQNEQNFPVQAKPKTPVQRENPFANKASVPKVFGKKDHPFVKQTIDKENIGFHMNQNQQKTGFVFGEPAIMPNNPYRKVVNPIPVGKDYYAHPHISQHLQHQQAYVLPQKKSRKQLIAEVMEYFLNSQVVDDNSSKLNSLQIEVREFEMTTRVVEPLAEAFLSDLPVNDSYKDLYHRDEMHDVQLKFEKDDIVIKAHKIVLMESEWFRDKMKRYLEYNRCETLPTLSFSREYDSDTFAKVVKVMYLSNMDSIHGDMADYRKMYRVACKIQAKYVQKYLIVHKLLPNLSIDNCLDILNEAYSKLENPTIDDSVKILYELTKLYCARRFVKLISTQKDIINLFDSRLLLVLVSKALYFITDEHHIQLFMKSLIENNVAEDIVHLSTKICKDYKKAITHDSQRIDLSQIINEMGFTPMRFDLINEETTTSSSKSKSAMKADLKQDLARDRSKQNRPIESELENLSPTENRLSSEIDKEISSKECNLEISLKLGEHDFIDKEGVTFISECFHSFSCTWNLKIDIQKDGTVSVFLVERSYLDLPEGVSNQLLPDKEATVRQIIDNGKHSTYPMNFKSVLFSVSVVDKNFSKDFKIFYSFSKDQKQIIGCKNFLNMNLLGSSDNIHLKVRISEKIMHSAIMHFLASQFHKTAQSELKNDPHIDRRVTYCLIKRTKDTNSNDYRSDWNRQVHSPDANRRRRRPSTPPSRLKRNMRLDNGYRDDHRDRHYVQKPSQKTEKTYCNLTHYDLSFLLESNYLNVDKESVVLDAVNRFCIKVIDDPAVINRLIRAVRFNYLELNEILSVAGTNKKIFSKSHVFQAMLSSEIERRLIMGLGIHGAEPKESARNSYISTAKPAANTNIAHIITDWLANSETNGKNEKMISKLRFELNTVKHDRSKLKRHFTEKINDIKREKEALEMNRGGKSYIPNILRNRRSPEESKTPPLALGGMPRKSGKFGSDRGSPEKGNNFPLISKATPADHDSLFSFTENNDKLHKVDADFRLRKMKEKEEEEKRLEDLEKYKRGLEKQNQPVRPVVTNPLSMKRREDMRQREQRRVEHGQGGYSAVGVHTPMAARKPPTGTTYVSKRRNKSLWNTVMDGANCTIF